MLKFVSRDWNSDLFSTADHFASVSGSDEPEVKRSGRRAAALPLLLLIPLLGCAGLTVGAQVRTSVCRRVYGPSLNAFPSRCERCAAQLRSVAAARREVAYWRQKTTGPGPVKASDRAKLACWERGYRGRCLVFEHLFGRSHHD